MIRRLTLALTVLALAGCADLGAKPWQRGTLARPDMQLNDDPVRPDRDDHDAFIDRVIHELDARFGINHPTLQIEHGPHCGHDRHDRAPHH